jgi:hypothetical protein
MRDKADMNFSALVDCIGMGTIGRAEGPSGQIRRVVDPIHVGDPHRAAPRFFLRGVHNQPRENLPVETTHRRGDQHPFRRPARAHDRMHTAASHRG